MKWEDFFREPKLEGVKETGLLLTSATALYLLRSDHVLAAADIKSRIIRSFDPLIDLIQGLSYPVAVIMLTAGFLVIMTGQKKKGIHLIKWAAIGFIGLQFVPVIMNILIEVGGAMKG